MFKSSSRRKCEGVEPMKNLLIVLVIFFCQSLSAEQIGFQSIYKKSIFRLANLIPEIKEMREDGKNVYEKAVRAVKKK